MHTVSLRTNVDAAKRLVSKLESEMSFRPNGDDLPRHQGFNPQVGDTVVLHRSYGKEIRMLVCGRTWDVTASGTELELELTVPHGHTTTSFTAHVKECGFPVY